MVKMGRLRKWFVVLVYALALFPPCSCYDETNLLFLEQQPPSVLLSSAESHYRATAIQRQLLHPQFILHVCVVMTVDFLGVLALGLFSVNLTYTVLNALVLSTTSGRRTKQDYSR